MNIHKKALMCQDGVNPRAIARLLVEAVDAACEGTGSDGAKGDSAVYLVMDKLASLGLYPQSFDGYGEHYDTCDRLAEEVQS